MMSVMALFQNEKLYFKLFLAGVVNGIGDRFSQVALFVLLLQITGSGLAVGITLAIRVIPFLLFGPLGGFLADQISRKKILIATDLLRIVFALSYIFVQDESQLWIVYVSTFILAAGEAIYAPARKSLIPLIVRKENIVKVNSFEQVMLGVVLIIGSISGGIVSYFFGPTMTFWLNGLSFLFAAIIIWTLPLKHKHQKSAKENHKTSFFQKIFTLRKLIIASSPLMIVFLFEIFVPIFNGIDNVLISVYAVEEFKLGDIGVGLFYGSLGMGLMLSYLVAHRMKQHLLLIGVASLVLEGIFHSLLSFVHMPILAILIYMSVSFLAGICNTCMDSTVMNEVPAHHQGFIFGILATISNTLIGLSMFTSGILLEVMSNRMLGFIGGSGLVLTGGILFTLFALKSSKMVKVNI